MKTAIFAVKLETALKVRPFISKAETRYYLRGIRITALNTGGAACAATDGHRLGVARDHTGFCDREEIVQIPAYVRLKRKLKSDRSKAVQWLVGVSSGSSGYGAVVYTETEDPRQIAAIAVDRPDLCETLWGNAFIDGNYPSIERVVQNYGDDARRLSLNSKLLESFGPHVSIAVNGDDGPILVRTSDPDLFGVMMPMINDVAYVPEWFREPTPKTEPPAANDRDAAKATGAA